MDGVSGASAVLGILQVGFSLAQAIRETVKEYKGAGDDLRKLARDIDRTLYVVSRLETLIAESDTNGSFDSGGLETMKECQKHTEQIVEALIALLTNSGVSYKPEAKIKPSDLVISRSNRMSWLGRKAHVKEKQEELKDIYLEVNTIINLRDAIQAMPGPEQAAKKAMAVESERRRRKRVQLRQNVWRDTLQSQRRPSVKNTEDATGDPLVLMVASPILPHHDDVEESNSPQPSNSRHPNRILAREIVWSTTQHRRAALLATLPMSMLLKTTLGVAMPPTPKRRMMVCSQVCMA